MKSLLIAFGCLVVAVVYARLLTRYATRQKRSDVIDRFQDRSAELHFLKGQTVSDRKRQAWR